MAQDIEEGENPRIDSDTRARAMASVADLGKPVAAPSKGGPVAAPSKGGPVAVPGRGGPVAAGTLTKKTPIITKEELEKSGLSLRDYMNKQQGLTRRQDKVDPDMGAKADEAFSDYRKKLEAETPPIALDVANQQRKEKLARLKLASAGAESKMRQANASSMSRADFVKGYASGGSVSASRRGDGIAQRGKTRGRMC